MSLTQECCAAAVLPNLPKMVKVPTMDSANIIIIDTCPHAHNGFCSLIYILLTYLKDRRNLFKKVFQSLKMSTVEDVQILMENTYEASIRICDDKLRSLSAEIESLEASLDSLKQEFAVVAQKRKVDDEGLQQIKRMRMTATTSSVTSRMQKIAIDELKVSLKSLVSADKYNKSLNRSSCDFEHRVAAYRRQLQLRLGETGTICHLRILMLQFLFVKSWYGNNLRLGVNSSSKLTLH